MHNRGGVQWMFTMIFTVNVPWKAKHLEIYTLSNLSFILMVPLAPSTNSDAGSDGEYVKKYYAEHWHSMALFWSFEQIYC